MRRRAPRGHLGRRLERQGEAERRADPRQAFGPDPAAVQGTMARQMASPRPDPAAPSRCPIELREHLLEVARGQVPGRSPPPTRRPRRPATCARSRISVPRRRISGRILEQVAEHLLDQRARRRAPAADRPAGRPSPCAPRGGPSAGAAPNPRSRRANASRARARSRRSQGGSSAAPWPDSSDISRDVVVDALRERLALLRRRAARRARRDSTRRRRSRRAACAGRAIWRQAGRCGCARSPPRARSACARVRARTLSTTGDDQADRQHDRKREQILQSSTANVPRGGTKKKLKARDAAGST